MPELPEQYFHNMEIKQLHDDHQIMFRKLLQEFRSQTNALNTRIEFLEEKICCKNAKRIECVIHNCHFNLCGTCEAASINLTWQLGKGMDCQKYSPIECPECGTLTIQQSPDDEIWECPTCEVD